MLLSDSKKTSLIQLINCKEKWTVKNISDLFDGKLFCDIIQEVFPETFELLKEEGQINFNYEEKSKGEEICDNVNFELENQEMICEDTENENTVIKDSGAVQESDKSAVHESESILPTISTSESVPEQVNSAAGDKKTVLKSNKSVFIDGATISKPVESASNNSESFTKPSEKDENLTSNRYRLIQYFIDVRYNLKSETVITFSECWGKDELELAKVLIFIMSEVVRHYVRSDDPLIQTLSHIDATVQQNLEQCFNFFINERGSITKEEVEKILTSSAPYKISGSPNNGYCSTPRSCSSKYRRLSSKQRSQSQETVYTNSPLKTYFESPVFTKADIVSKEKEILKMKQILYEEESNSYSLEQKIQYLEKKLQEKNNEINNFKTRNRMLREKEKSEDCKNCVKYEKIIKENKRRIKELEVDIKEHNEETCKKFEDIFIGYQVEVAESMSGFQYHLRNAEKDIREVTEELNKIKKEKKELEETITKVCEELDEKNKELEVCKEKLMYADTQNKKELESTVFGECMGGYFKEENEKLSFDISHTNLAVHKEEKSVSHVMVQFPEEPISVESVTSKPELLTPINVPDCEIIENSKKSSKTAKKEFSNVRDDTEKLDIRSKQFICSSPKEAFTGSSYTSVAKEGIGSLWHHYDNTLSEKENENNNCHSVTNDGIHNVWQNNNFIPEMESAEGSNSLTKALNILHKTEYDLNQMSRRLSTVSKVSSAPNGSNGLFGSPIIREFLEELKKSLHKSMLCLSQAGETQMKCQNNNSLSKKRILEVGHNSEVAAFSKCFECSKVEKNVSDNTRGAIINQESSALLEKTQELQYWKDKYKVALKTYAVKEKELENCKRKYSYVKDMYQESLRHTKDIELKCQKLETDLKEFIKKEAELKRENKRQKIVFKTQIRETFSNWKELQEKVVSLKKEMKDMTEENKKLRCEIYAHMSKNDILSSHIKNLEKELEETNVNVNEYPSTSNAATEYKSVKGIKDEDAVSESNIDDTTKLEIPSSKLIKVISQDTENESISCALQQKSFQSSLHLYNYDEEEFLNHSSLAAIHNSHENTDNLDLTRMHELLRRNTLLPEHLQSHYAIENLPETPIEKNLSKSVKGHILKAINPGPEKNVHIGKKRKVSELETSNQSSLSTTPMEKIRKKLLQTPGSLKKWCGYRRNQRSGSIKPKP